MAKCPLYDKSEEENKCFLRRVSDKKFYRGAKLWRFTTSWRSAAVLRLYSWKFMFDGGSNYLANSTDEFEFVFLNDLE